MTEASDISPTVLELKNEVATYPLLKDRRILLLVLLILSFISLGGLAYLVGRLLRIEIPAYVVSMVIAFLVPMLRAGIAQINRYIPDNTLASARPFPSPASKFKINDNFSSRLILTKRGVVIVYKETKSAEHKTGLWYPFESIESILQQGAYLIFNIHHQDNPIKLFLRHPSKEATPISSIIDHWMAHHAGVRSTRQGKAKVEANDYTMAIVYFGIVGFVLMLAGALYIDIKPWWLLPLIVTASALWGLLTLVGLRIYIHPLNLASFMRGKDQTMLQIKTNHLGHTTTKPLPRTHIESLSYQRLALQINSNENGETTEYRLGPMFRHTAEAHIEKLEALQLKAINEVDKTPYEK